MMWGIFLVKFKMLLRNPWSYIILTASIMAFAFLLGSNISSKAKLPVYSDLPMKTANMMLEELNESKTFNYVLMGKTDAIKRVKENKSELAVELKEDSAIITVASSGQNSELVKYEILAAYQKAHKKSVILSSGNPQNKKNLEEKMKHMENYSVFEVEKKGFKAKDTAIYDHKLQGLFGFALFFVVYTIAFNVVSILTEKEQGVWDRMLLSPLKKWQMYTGNLLYSFITGYAQLAIVFCIFRFGLNISFHGSFVKALIIIIPYVFCIIAMSLLIASLVKNMQQFNVVLPLVSVSMAMVGGAYWPLEMVTSKPLLFLSNFTPIFYGMDALKGATVYGLDWNALMYPISMMFLIGVVVMGIGIKLMDRK